MLTSRADVPLLLPGRDDCHRRSVCHRSETRPTSGRRDLAVDAGDYLLTDDAWRDVGEDALALWLIGVFPLPL